MKSPRLEQLLTPETSYIIFSCILGIGLNDCLDVQVDNVTELNH